MKREDVYRILKDVYAFLTFIAIILTFIGSWIYCMEEYGFLLGFGLGWLPSLLLAVLVSRVWPLVLLVLAFSLSR